MGRIKLNQDARKPFNFRKPGGRRPEPGGREPRQPQPEEELTGWVQGRRASDIEERFARAAARDPDVERVQFQVSYVAGRSLPGEVRLDFLLTSGGILYPVWTDGGYWHKSQQQKDEDRFHQDVVDDLLRGLNAQLSQRVPGSDLETLEEARRAVRDVLEGAYLRRD